jgi:hypothetical protein
LHLQVEGLKGLLNAKVSCGHDEHWRSGQKVWLRPATGFALAFDGCGALLG